MEFVACCCEALQQPSNQQQLLQPTPPPTAALHRAPHPREEQRSFEAWRDSLETVPTIKALRTMAEGIRAAEFEERGSER